MDVELKEDSLSLRNLLVRLYNDECTHCDRNYRNNWFQSSRKVPQSSCTGTSNQCVQFHALRSYSIWLRNPWAGRSGSVNQTFWDPYGPLTMPVRAHSLQDLQRKANCMWNTSRSRIDAKQTREASWSSGHQESTIASLKASLDALQPLWLELQH